MSKTGQITEKQERFAQEYIIDLNATQAYKRAGYSVKSDKAAAVEGHKLLRNPKVAARIAELQNARQKRTEITQDRVLEELAAIGFAEITDFVQVVESSYEQPKDDPIGQDDGEDDEDGLPKTTETKFFRGVEIFETSKMPKGAIPAIASIKQGRSGIELKLHDKVKALELMGRHLGIFEKDNAQSKPVNNINVDALTIDEKVALEKLLSKSM